MRLHRAGEGAPYTGLKVAGHGEGPVIAVAEGAIRTGSADELVRVLTEVVADQIKTRLDRVMALNQQEHGSVAAAREYVEAMLGLQVWAHKLYLAATNGPHYQVASWSNGLDHPMIIQTQGPLMITPRGCWVRPGAVHPPGANPPGVPGRRRPGGDRRPRDPRHPPRHGQLRPAAPRSRLQRVPALAVRTGRPPASTGAVLRSILQVCITREFAILADRTSPVVTWLRALAANAHRECGGPGVGAIGMCLTGGFALAMAVEPAVLAPILSRRACRPR